ncbi:MAG: hypothetical protein ACP5D6_06460 [Kosmotogaceae bacterium]
MTLNELITYINEEYRRIKTNLESTKGKKQLVNEAYLAGKLDAFMDLLIITSAQDIVGPMPKQIWLNGSNIAINWDDGIDTSAQLADGDLWHLEAGVFLALLKRFIPYSTIRNLIKGIKEENIDGEAYKRLRKYADIRAVYGEKLPEKEKVKK